MLQEKKSLSPRSCLVETKATSTKTLFFDLFPSAPETIDAQAAFQ